MTTTPWFLRKRWTIPAAIVLVLISIIMTPLIIHAQQWRQYDQAAAAWQAKGVALTVDDWLARQPPVDVDRQGRWFRLLEEIRKLPYEDKVPERNESWGQTATESSQAREAARAESKARQALSSRSRAELPPSPPFIKWRDRPIGPPPPPVQRYLDRTRPLAASAATLLAEGPIIVHSGGRGAWLKQTGQIVHTEKILANLLESRMLLHALSYHALAEPDNSFWWQAIDGFVRGFQGSPSQIELIIQGIITRYRDDTYLSHILNRKTPCPGQWKWMRESLATDVKGFGQAQALELV